MSIDIKMETKMAAELIFPAKNIVGESLIWDDENNRLLWVDIVGKSIHSLVPETDEYHRWQTPDSVTSLGLRKDGGAIVAFTKTINLWDFDGNFRHLATVESDRPSNRLNEGVVGPDGAFWVGTMQNNITPDGNATDITEDTGQLYRCNSDGQVDRFAMTNSASPTL